MTGEILYNWDLHSKKLSEPFVGHRALVTAAAFSADGSYLATSSDDHSARIWDAKTGRAKALPFEYPEGVGKIALSPNGTKLAIAHGKTVSVWDVAQRQEYLVPVLNGFVDSLEFSPDGKSLACGAAAWSQSSSTWFRMLRVWDWAPAVIRLNSKKESPMATRTDHLVFSPNGRFLAVGDLDGSLEIWDLPRGAKSFDLQGHPRGGAIAAFAGLFGNLVALLDEGDSVHNADFRETPDHIARSRMCCGSYWQGPSCLDQSKSFQWSLSDLSFAPKTSVCR